MSSSTMFEGIIVVSHFELDMVKSMFQQARTKSLSLPPPSAFDIFLPYHVQPWGASFNVASNISNDYQYGEGEKGNRTMLRASLLI